MRYRNTEEITEIIRNLSQLEGILPQQPSAIYDFGRYCAHVVQQVSAEEPTALEQLVDQQAERFAAAYGMQAEDRNLFEEDLLCYCTERAYFEVKNGKTAELEGERLAFRDITHPLTEKLPEFYKALRERIPSIINVACPERFRERALHAYASALEIIPEE
jgi:hypothetical protein